MTVSSTYAAMPYVSVASTGFASQDYADVDTLLTLSNSDPALYAPRVSGNPRGFQRVSRAYTYGSSNPSLRPVVPEGY